MCCSVLQCTCWFFVWKICLLLTVGYYNPYYECVSVYIFPEVLQGFPFIFGCFSIGCIYVYNVYVFLMDSSLEYTEVFFCVSFYGLCFEIYFVWCKYYNPSFFSLSICLEYFFPTLHFRFMWVFCSEVGPLLVAYVWVMFSYLFRYPMSFDWSI